MKGTVASVMIVYFDVKVLLTFGNNFTRSNEVTIT